MMRKHDSEALVSIVIPVYNSERYLKECMDSLLCQSFKGLQVICVDDASTDASLQILSMYMKNDRRVSFIKGDHAGAAAARNLGMRHACGKYIMFLDSDDVFEPDMIEELYESAQKGHAEIAICGFDTDMEHNGRDFVKNMEKWYLGRYSETAFCMEDLPLHGFWMWGIPSWTKLYELDFLRRTRLQFQQIKSSNDKYFSVMSMIYAKRMIHTSSYKAFVHYRTNIEGQISASRKVMDSYLAWEKIYKEMRSQNITEKIYMQYYAWVLSDFIYELTRKCEGYKEKKAFYDFLAKDGMENIGLNHWMEENGLGIYQDLWKCIKNNTFESQWYEQRIGICVQLEARGSQEIKELCRKKRIALWGIGERGVAVLKLFNREKIWLAGVIDSDFKKQGMEVCGYQVQPYLELKDQIDMVMIVSKAACNSICSDLLKCSGNNTEILPLFVWLESGMRLEECVFDLRMV